MFKLGTHIIKSISGPISITVLTPTEKFHSEFPGRTPIFMLFGDEHESLKGICKKCECQKCGGEKCSGCCLEIFSEEMFTLFNNLSTHSNPIDFYTEYFIRKEEVQEFSNNTDKYALVNKTRRDFKDIDKNTLGAIGNTLLNNLPCFIKDYRKYSDFKQVCKFDNIRWQYSDVRLITYASKYDFEGNLRKIGDLLIESIANWIEGLTSQPILNMNEINNILELYDETSKAEFLKCACEMFNTPEIFITTMMNSPLLSKSLMFKQIRKLPEGFNSEDYWKKLIIKYYTTKILSDKELKIYLKKKQLGSEMYKYWKMYFFGKTQKIVLTQKNNHDVWEDYITTLLTGTLDIYFITRSLKTPLGSKNPFLSIGFFGDFHCENLIYFLTEITDWYNVHSSEITQIKNDFRCLNLSKVDFDYNKLKAKYGLQETHVSTSESSSTVHGFNGLTKNISDAVTHSINKYLDSESKEIIKKSIIVNTVNSLKGYTMQPEPVNTGSVFDPIVNHRIKSIFSKGI